MSQFTNTMKKLQFIPLSYTWRKKIKLIIKYIFIIIIIIISWVLIQNNYFTLFFFIIFYYKDIFYQY